MNIGIDIDGVLNDQYTFCIDYGTKFCSEIGKYRLENINAFNTTDMFLWENNIAHQFCNKYREELAAKLPARKFASEVIEKLKESGNKIYIITARKNGDEWFPEELQYKVEDITKEWLKKNHIFYDKIIFDSVDKGKVCVDHHIDVMIEDEPRNLDKLIGKTKVIIFDHPYNRDKKYKEIIRAYSWYDIYSKLQELDLNKKD